MGILSAAFNALANIHSRSAIMKRLGTPDLTSNIRITPSNYFRFLEGPSHTVSRGREFIIPVTSIVGTPIQTISFDVVPTTGTFLLTYNGTDTTLLGITDDAASIQVALRLIPALANVVVAGSFATQTFTVTFYGVATPYLLTSTLTLGDELDATISIVQNTVGQPWSGGTIKRGDKILDNSFGSMAIDEIIEMVDLGGAIMAYRVRCE